MSKINVNWKRLTSLTMAALMTLVMTACRQEDKKEIVDNKIGSATVKYIGNTGLEAHNFAVLDVGDHDRVETIFQNKKMTMCNEEGVCLGVVISSDAEDEASIYDDVEYAKGIVRDYKVKFPVYLNIDKIITNDNLNIEMKTKIIKNFLEKCSANNIYVGLHGTDTNLCRVKKYCGITGYDALVVKEKDTIDYDGPYIVYQELDGTLVATTDLEEIIIGNSLNSSDNFANDGSYTISSEDELTDIALSCGMSVNELLEFNNLSRQDIVENTVLRIPSQIDTRVPQGEVTYKTLDTPIVGCDMSYAQSDSPDWGKMKETFDFIILRSNIGLDEDDYFAKNAQQANLADIPIGAYCYNPYNSNTFATSAEFIKKLEQQADFTISVLKNNKIEYPVYLDVEGRVDASTYKKEDVQAMLEVWSNKMTAAGYIPGLYCNQSTFRYLQSCVDYDLSDKLEVWVAGGAQYSSTEGDCTKHTHINVDSVEPSSVLYNKDFGATMAQSTNIARGPAGDARGHLDVNYSLVDYSDREQAEALPSFEIKEFSGSDRIDWGAFGINAGAITLGGLALVGGSILAIKELCPKSKKGIKLKVKK